jgi:hypothetical protein
MMTRWMSMRTEKVEMENEASSFISSCIPPCEGRMFYG